MIVFIGVFLCLMCTLGICTKFVGSHQDVKQHELVEEPEDPFENSEREQLSSAKHQDIEGDDPEPVKLDQIVLEDQNEMEFVQDQPVLQDQPATQQELENFQAKRVNDISMDIDFDNNDEDSPPSGNKDDSVSELAQFEESAKKEPDDIPDKKDLSLIREESMTDDEEEVPDEDR